MTKRQIDRLLETAVAEALGLPPALRRGTAAALPRAASGRRTRRSRMLETA